MSLREYIESVGDLPPDVLLGRIVLFTISDTPVRLPDMKKWFKELGLNESLLPLPNKASDAFKRATSDTKGSYPMSKGRTANLIRREVTANKEFIQHQITREIVNPGKKKLGYSQAIVCRFYRPGVGGEARVAFTVTPQELSRDELPHIQQAAQDLYQRYTDYMELLSDQKVRGVIRSYLKHLNAIEIKGGVYFVHAMHDDELSRLQELVGKLGGDSEMNMIPIVDLERERVFISRVFEREAAEQLDTIVREAREIMTSRKTITPAAYAKIRERYDEVVENAMEHMANLRITQSLTSASAEIAEKTLGDLFTEMMKSDRTKRGGAHTG